MPTQVVGFAIFGKRVRVCTTIIRGPISSLLRDGHKHPRLRQRWAVDKGEISKGVNRRRGCGLM
jgi:hypothetical protein